MKKFLAVLLTIMLVVGVMPMSIFTIKASAETSGYYTYSVNNGEATITDVNTSISGDIEIPLTLAGYPVTSIGDEAFAYCSSLTSVTIGNSVTIIGDSAFYGCGSLTSITIPDSVKSIGDWSFSVCSSLTSITIPNNVTSIGDHAFYYCSSLTSVTIGNSVTSIGDWSFEKCSSLTSVTIGNSVTSIGDWSFLECSSLTSITIPDSVTNIGDCAFSDCSSLKSVTIPNSVTSIGGGAFVWCISLMTINVDEGNENYSSQNGVLFNKDKTELICCPGGKIGKYSIPNSVTSIGYSAFSGCSSLTSIAIPNSVTSIGNDVFSGCSSLTSIAIPDSVTSIGGSAFYKCSSLTSVTIPNSVTSIGDVAFFGCSGLTSITIPDSVTSIGNSAFYNCSSLTSVTIPDSVTSIGRGAFSGCYNLTIYGYSGTKAETYALAYDIKFIPITDLVDSENNVAVSGELPAETQLQVDIIATTATGVIYDITLIQNGEEIQPTGSVTVKIPLPEGINSGECKVYREEKNGHYTDMNAVYKDGFMVFTTEHFGKYVLTSEDLGVIIGDLDGDGELSDWDGVLLARYLAGWNVEIPTLDALDIDGDGEITDWDGVVLDRYLAGWNISIG